mmetsp:Transcript_22866/g.65325  ORF Transcript_22866/g.65325 Transcript_22866/m.65325 type:complete len:229 (+) Transcript_22866:2100-2786(+)
MLAPTLGSPSAAAGRMARRGSTAGTSVAIGCQRAHNARSMCPGRCCARVATSCCCCLSTWRRRRRTDSRVGRASTPLPTTRAHAQLRKRRPPPPRASCKSTRTPPRTAPPSSPPPMHATLSSTPSLTSRASCRSDPRSSGCGPRRSPPPSARPQHQSSLRSPQRALSSRSWPPRMYFVPAACGGRGGGEIAPWPVVFFLCEGHTARYLCSHFALSLTKVHTLPYLILQ